VEGGEGLQKNVTLKFFTNFSFKSSFHKTIPLYDLFIFNFSHRFSSNFPTLKCDKTRQIGKSLHLMELQECFKILCGLCRL
jgi:hypothetical protein